MKLTWEKRTYEIAYLTDNEAAENRPYLSYSAAPPIGNGPETAICTHEEFFILLGDWRKQYEETFEKDGFGGCLALFELINGSREWIR